MRPSLWDPTTNGRQRAPIWVWCHLDNPQVKLASLRRAIHSTWLNMPFPPYGKHHDTVPVTPVLRLVVSNAVGVETAETGYVRILPLLAALSDFV